MNIIDYILLTVILLYVLMGFARGVLAQLLGFAGLGFALFCGYLFHQTSGNLFLMSAVIIVAGIIFKIVVYIIKKVFFKLRKVKPRLTFISRITAGALSGLWAMALVFVILLGVYASSGVLFLASPAAGNYFNNSFLYSYLERNNIFSNITMARRINFSGRLLYTGLKGNTLYRQELISRLQEIPSFRAALKDKELVQNIRDKNYKKVLSNPKFLKLLQDKGLFDQLLCIIKDNTKDNPQK